MYVGLSLPTILAFSNENDVMVKLLASIQHLLPNRYYAHLSPGLESVLDATHDLESHGKHYKMALINKTLTSSKECSYVECLSMKDLASIQALYKESYPENWLR